MKIISASRRTDIPAFHSDWLINRLREGVAHVGSPFNNKLRSVSLAPENVIAIIFWTKNSAPLTRYLDEISTRGYDFTFLYTVNNYPKLVEPNVPEIGLTMRTLEHLFDRYGSSALRWRYDTIILTETLNRSWHINNFRKLCGIMGPLVDECIFSFCDYYKKTKAKMRNHLPDHHEPTQEEAVKLALELADVASEHGIRMLSCAHDFLSQGPIGSARCIDRQFLKRVVTASNKLERLANVKSRPTRKGCRCDYSIDIGEYNTCDHNCVYCYASNEHRIKDDSRVQES
ncbi:MAG: DUF1848 domain-containing protein [Desulfomonilaceae bacterium]|jgi:hypothetical protein